MLDKLKIWEVLLAVAVLFLGVIAYEMHKANNNTVGRYVPARERGYPSVFDTKTGQTWKWNKEEKEWETFMEPIPSRSSPQVE